MSRIGCDAAEIEPNVRDLGTNGGEWLISTQVWRTNDAEKKKKIKTRSFGAFLLVEYLVFPSVSATILRYYVCEEFEGYDEWGSLDVLRVMQADYEISCDSARYKTGGMAYATLMLFVYPIGIPSRARVPKFVSFDSVRHRLFWGIQLYRNRHKINPDLERMPGETDVQLMVRKLEIRDNDESIHHLAFLFDEYEPRSARILTAELVPGRRFSTSAASPTTV